MLESGIHTLELSISGDYDSEIFYEIKGNIDIKRCSKPISKKRLKGKTVFLASVTDCYNPYEEKYCITQSILKQLMDVECRVSISTKSSLILQTVSKHD